MYYLVYRYFAPSCNWRYIVDEFDSFRDLLIRREELSKNNYVKDIKTLRDFNLN